MSRSGLVMSTIALLALVLSGCGAAQTAATAADRPSVPGVNLTEGGIAIRNAIVEPAMEGYPAGSDVPIQLAVVNQTQQPIRLMEVRSDAAASVSVSEVVLVGPASPDTPPPAAGAGPLELAPGAFYAVTLQATGLRTALSGAGAIPLALSFDNDTVIDLSAPVAPPLEAPARGEPLDTGHH